MPDGMTRRDRYVCSVWAHNRFLADGHKCYCKWGAKFTHHTVGSFLATGIDLLLYRPINRFYILTAAEGR